MDKARLALSAKTAPNSEAKHACDAEEEALRNALRSAVRKRLRAEELFLEALERIADQLPEADPKLFAEVLRRLPPLAEALDRDLILEFLLEQNFEAPLASLQRQIRRLTLEGKADCSAMLELAEAMEPVIRGAELRDVGALAYLLRGVLENRRRHLVWADEVIGQDLPSLKGRDEALRQAIEESAGLAAELRMLFTAR